MKPRLRRPFTDNEDRLIAQIDARRNQSFRDRFVKPQPWRSEKICKIEDVVSVWVKAELRGMFR